MLPTTIQALHKWCEAYLNNDQAGQTSYAKELAVLMPLLAYDEQCRAAFQLIGSGPEIERGLGIFMSVLHELPYCHPPRETGTEGDPGPAR